MMATSDAVIDEDSLARILLSKWSVSAGIYFGKISQIPRGKRINPDIDLLRVCSSKDRSETVGYELKVLRYNLRNKSVPLTPFYTGLGKVLSYFRNGIDRAELVLAFHPNCGQHADQTERTIGTICRNLQETSLSSIRSLAISVVREASKHAVLFNQNWELTSFSHDEDGRHKRRCLLRGEFACEQRYTR